MFYLKINPTFILCLTLSLLCACGSKNDETLPFGDGGVSGNIPINPGDGEDPEPIPTPTPNPDPVLEKFEFSSRKWSGEEEKKIVVPYKKLFFPLREPGRPEGFWAWLRCRREGRKHCVKNKQVAFAVDYDREALPNGLDVKVVDIVLKMDFYSNRGDKRAEMFCIVNNHVRICEGTKDKLMGTSAAWEAQLFSWKNKKFWNGKKGGKMLKNGYVWNKIKNNYNPRTKLFEKEGLELSLKDMYELSEQDLWDVVFRNVQDAFYFIVSDDTFVTFPSLTVILEVIPED